MQYKNGLRRVSGFGHRYLAMIRRQHHAHKAVHRYTQDIAELQYATHTKVAQKYLAFAQSMSVSAARFVVGHPAPNALFKPRCIAENSKIMMNIYVIRHAWAADREYFRGSTDWERPLTHDGRKRFAAMVKRLVERGFRPEVIATSPLVRCRQTAEIVAEITADSASILEVDALQPGSDLEAMLAWTEREAGACEQVAWVGHAPDVGRLTGRLIGEGALRFAKGAVAAIRFDGPPAPGCGELRWLVTAKLLGC